MHKQLLDRHDIHDTCVIMSLEERAGLSRDGVPISSLAFGWRNIRSSKSPFASMFISYSRSRARLVREWVGERATVMYHVVYVWSHAFHGTCMTDVLVAVEVGGTDHVDKCSIDGNTVFGIASLQSSQILQRTSTEINSNGRDVHVYKCMREVLTNGRKRKDLTIGIYLLFKHPFDRPSPVEVSYYTALFLNSYIHM